MSDVSGAAPEFDAARLSSELALQSFYASEHDRPLFIIVNYDHEADKVSFLERLRKKLVEKGISTRTLVFENNKEDQFIKVYDLISEATREKSISIITDLPRQGSGISPDFLFYINLHRDRIARQNLRFILFLHSSDSERFINSAGDLWDFRDRTYWLERTPYTETRSFWQNLDEKNAALEKPEEDEKEISDHIALVKKIVEQTENPEERASLMLDLAGWLERRHLYDLSIESAIEGIRLISGKRIRLMAELKSKVGYVLFLKGNFYESLKYFEESLAVRRELGDRQGEGTTLNNISQIYRAWGRNEEALKVLEESLTISRELGDRKNEGVMLNNISQIYHDWGRYEEALKALEESLAIRRELGDRQGEGTTLNNISQIYRAWGRNEEALKLLEESLAIRRELGDRHGEGTTLNNISQIYHDWGRYEEALKVLEESLTISRELGGRKNEGVMLNNISQIYHDWGRYEEALKALEESLAIRRELGDRHGEGTRLNNISQIYRAWGRNEEALKLLEESLAIRRELGDRQGEGTTINNIAQIYDVWGRYEEALKLLEQSLAISREIGDKKNEGLVCWNIGLEYERRDDLGKAINYVRKAVEIEMETKNPDYQSSLDYLKKLEEKAFEQAQSIDASNGPDKP